MSKSKIYPTGLIRNNKNYNKITFTVDTNSIAHNNSVALLSNVQTLHCLNEACKNTTI